MYTVERTEKEHRRNKEESHRESMFLFLNPPQVGKSSLHWISLKALCCWMQAPPIAVQNFVTEPSS